MKEIIILCGIPTSGKSTFALYQQKIHKHIILSRDNIRDKFFGKDYVHSRKNEEEITKIFNTWYNKYVKEEKDLILDNCHTKEVYLDNWLRQCPKGYTMRIVFFDISLWKAYYRNIVRWILTGKWIPFKVLNDMKKNYDKINKSKYL